MRDAWWPAHLHAISEAAAQRPLVTELFLEDDPYLDRDAVFGVSGPEPGIWSIGRATFSGTLIPGGGCHEAEALRG
ncbi:hypothetical protein [Falsiroseomonas bella]|nr:hypothetical protein [Falsiroseomonas bella]